MMTEQPPHALTGRSILVVEDDYYLAQDIAREIRVMGAEVIGPVSNVADALGLLEETPGIDGAVLDINLMGELAYPIADGLRARGTPFIFVTGYDTAHIPLAYQDVVCCQKPLEMERLAQALLL